MTSLLRPAFGLATDMAAPVLRVFGRRPARRAGGRSGRTHIEVRGMHRDGAAEARALVTKQLQALPGVHGAVVNAALGRVVVDHEPSVTVAALLSLVAEVEEAHGLAGAEAPEPGSHHPADLTALTRQLVALGLDLTGLGAVLVERALTPLPVTSTLVPPAVTAALSLTDAVPSLRELAERAAGASATESWFSIGSATAQALGRGPVGLVADACYRAIRAGESAGRHRAWQAWDRAAELAAHRADPDPAQDVDRPVPLRPGPVERAGDGAGLAALGALAVATPLLPQRTVAVTLAGVPKAARWGREAFAAAAAAALAERGVVVLDPSALRRADRVDVVVVDPALQEVPPIARAASRVGRVVVAETASWTRHAIAEMQRDGHGVALVSGDADAAAAAALAAADVAIFVSGAGPERAAASWYADLWCGGPDTVVAALAVLAAAPGASRRAAALAVLASCAALPAALLSPIPGHEARASLPVTMGALASLGAGAWTGTAAGRAGTPATTTRS